MNHSSFALLACLRLTSGCVGYQVSDQNDEGEYVREADQEIINGSSDFTGALSYIEQRTVRIRTPAETVCTGTLVLPNVVMTARHCVTTNKTIGGPVATPSVLRARLMGDPGIATAPFDPCEVGPDRDPSCAIGANIQQISAGVDIAMIGLAAPLSLHDDWTMFTPIELSQNNSAYLGDDLKVSGWGRNTCAEGSGGTLRWGQMNVEALDVSNTFSGDGVTYTHLLRLGAVGNQGIYKGDSGGPLWGTTTYPAASLAVSTISAGCSGTSTPLDTWLVPVAANFAGVRTMLRQAANERSFREDLQNMNGLQVFDLLPSDGIPDWRVVSGHLMQKANAGKSVVLIGNTLVQRASGGAYSVSFSSSDNDSSGVVFSYVDQLNYLTCEVNEQNRVLQAVMMRNGARSVLASTDWFGDLSAGVTVTANVNPVSSAGTFSFPIRCTAQGGGVREETVQADNNTVLPAGRVGIFNDYLDEATYTAFFVSQPFE